MSAPTTTTGGTVSDAAGAAKDSSQAVASSAADHAKDLAGTASEKASDVVDEAKSQASDLFATAREQLGSEAENRRGQAVSSLRTLGDELDAMQSHDGDTGVATHLAGRGSGYVRQTADWLDGRQPSEILDDVKRFARERPGTFLLGALLAGIVAGRLTRAVKAGAPEPDATSGASASRHRADLAAAGPFASSQSGGGNALNGAQGIDPMYDFDADTHSPVTDGLATPEPTRPAGTL